MGADNAIQDHNFNKNTSIESLSNNTSLESFKRVQKQSEQMIKNNQLEKKNDDIATQKYNSFKLNRLSKHFVWMFFGSLGIFYFWVFVYALLYFAPYIWCEYDDLLIKAREFADRLLLFLFVLFLGKFAKDTIRSFIRK